MRCFLIFSKEEALCRLFIAEQAVAQSVTALTEEGGAINSLYINVVNNQSSAKRRALIILCLA